MSHTWRDTVFSSVPYMVHVRSEAFFAIVNRHIFRIEMSNNDIQAMQETK